MYTSNSLDFWNSYYYKKDKINDRIKIINNSIYNNNIIIKFLKNNNLTTINNLSINEIKNNNKELKKELKELLLFWY